MRDPGTFWHTTTGEIILKDGFIRHDPVHVHIRGNVVGAVSVARRSRHGAGAPRRRLRHATARRGDDPRGRVRVPDHATAPHRASSDRGRGAVGARAGRGRLALPRPPARVHHRGTGDHCRDCSPTATSKKLPLRRLVWLLPLFVIWANVHGGMLGGFGTVVIAVGGWIVFWRLGRPSPVESWRVAGLLGLLVHRLRAHGAREPVWHRSGENVAASSWARRS